MSEKTFVGMQVGGISFIDEGVEETLDIFTDLAGVNAIFISALSWARGNAGRSGSGDYPDHGGQEPDNLQGGAFFPPDPKYYHGTTIKDFTAPDPLYEGWDILGDVIPAAKERGMEVFTYYCETAHARPKPLWQPGFSQVLEIDAWGRKDTRPCFHNPNYKNWWFGVIDNWLNEYDLNGVMWGIEREDPLSSMIVSAEVPTCFCVHCRSEAHRRNIDAGRAAEGYRRIYDYLTAVRGGHEPPDGKLITFLRHLFEYPEVLQWQKLWWDGHKGLYREISGQIRFFGPQYQVGFGIWQMINTFNPLLRAAFDPAEYKLYADWLKPVFYNAPGGARFVSFVNKMCQTILGDASPSEWTPILYKILGLDEAPYEDLPAAGFSPEYVKEFTRRHVEAVGPDVQVYPGIGLGVETVDRAINPPDVEDMVDASLAGGAGGVMISRNYSELTLTNLAAVGTALRRHGRI
ncbi:MAG: hypothetical protein OXQ32_04155 [bacterium]|nr:hypothetical protein [bacterium]